MVADLVNYDSRKDGRPYLSDGAAAPSLLWEGSKEQHIYIDIYIYPEISVSLFS